MKNFLTIFALLFLFSCSKPPKEQQTSTQKEYETFFLYGELSADGYLDTWTTSKADSITAKYGFRLKRIAGCEIDEIDIKAVLLHNKKALKAMNTKYGNEWIPKFEKETHYKLKIVVE